MSMPRWFYGLLAFSILSIILSFLPVPPILLFLFAGAGIIPLAALLGQSVERIAEHTGEALGGLLFATFANSTELIIGIFALRDGLVDVVRAALIGGILGNVLLVLGVATCVGSIKHRRLRFERRSASSYASLLAICVAGLVLPTFAQLFATSNRQTNLLNHLPVLSDVIAVMLLIGYLLSVLFNVFHLGDREEAKSFRPPLGMTSPTAITHLQKLRKQAAYEQKLRSGQLYASRGMVSTNNPHTEQTSDTEKDLAAPELVLTKKPPLLPALLTLALVTVGIAWLSEILVGTIEPFTELLGWNPVFVGLIFLPLITTLPDFLNISRMALNKQMDMVLAATAGASIQIALLVAPVLVLISLFMPQRLNLVFSIVELAVLGLGTFLYSEITQDGELVWLEGGLLVIIYAMMGATVFFF